MALVPRPTAATSPGHEQALGEAFGHLVKESENRMPVSQRETPPRETLGEASPAMEGRSLGSETKADSSVPQEDGPCNPANLHRDRRGSRNDWTGTIESRASHTSKGGDAHRVLHSELKLHPGSGDGFPEPSSSLTW